MRYGIIFPKGFFNKLKGYLLSDLKKEYYCHIFCGYKKIKNFGLFLLARELALPEEGDYETQTSTSCILKKEYMQKLFYHCDQNRLCLVEAHSHPFSDNKVTFSAQDDLDEIKRARYFYRKIKKGYFATLVFGKNSFDGRIWIRRKGKIQNVPIEIFLQDIPFKRLFPTSSNKISISIDQERFSRQILAFGKEGQRALKTLTFGVVGVGGVGAIICEGLVRLGVETFILVDPDHAEISNLNRFLGMTYKDAIKGKRKVDIVKREIKRINPKAKVRPICKSVFLPEVYKQLKKVDILILATDTEASRLFINRFCVQYLIPMISAGTRIIVREDGTLDEIIGEIAVVLPGPEMGCLLCADAIDVHEAAFQVSGGVLRYHALRQGYIKGEDIKEPAVRHLNGIVANMALLEIHNLVCGFKPQTEIITFMPLTGEVVVQRIEKNPNCFTCGRGGLLGLGDIEPMPDYLRDMK